MTLECCCLLGKLQKQGKFVTSFVYKIDEIRAIFFKLGRLARRQNAAATHQASLVEPWFAVWRDVVEPKYLR